MKEQTTTFKRICAVMKDVNGDNRQIIKAMQEQIDYLMEFIAVQGEIIEQTTGCRQPELSEEQKRRLAYRGKKLNEFLLGQISQYFSPGISWTGSSATGLSGTSATLRWRDSTTRSDG